MSREAAASRALLARALESAAPAGGLEFLRLPAPPAPPERLLAAPEGEPRFSWSSPDEDQAWAGWGACALLEGSPAGWHAEVAAHAGRLLRDAAVRDLAPEAGPPAAARFFGGVAFDLERAATPAPDAPSWEAFGSCRFLLPRWSYRSDGKRATLTLARDAGRGDGAGEGPRTLAEFDALLRALERDEAAVPPPVIGSEEMPAARWRELVAAAQRAIAGGDFRKLVVARATRLRFAGRLAPAAVAARLRESAPGDHRFAFAPGRGEALLVGASPERLIRREGREVRLDPMAGSALLAEGASPDEIRAATVDLLASGKNRLEHESVIEILRGALAPLCAEVEAGPVPRVRVLPHLLHLHTPMRGTLREPLHVLDLLARIHPTPAVGGAPRETAAAWLRAHEPAPRGWYAGAFGWFDGQGDGDFALAIRSALLSGSEALVYAGAGIVAASDAAAEYEETAAKQAAMLRVLGAPGARAAEAAGARERDPIG